MKWSSVTVFVGAYLLFLPAGYLFRLDPAWYAAQDKPAWTPPGAVIGIVWAVLFACIAAALAMLDSKVGIANVGWPLASAIAANWIVNQAYTYFQFTRKDWGLATFDAALVALTAIAVIVLAWKVSRPAALLYAPYVAWSAFATFLSASIWSMNR